MIMAVEKYNSSCRGGRVPKCLLPPLTKTVSTQKYVDLFMRKFVLFVSKNDALLQLFRLHVSPFRALDFCGILSSC